MKKIEVYDCEARKIEALADQYDTTVAEVVELLCDKVCDIIDMGLYTEEEIFGNLRKDWSDFLIEKDILRNRL